MSSRAGRRRRDKPARRADSGAAAAPRRVESWAGGDWAVRPITGSASTKIYRCPGCDQEIRPATPHIVAWPLDDDASGQRLGERRHWHAACWERRDRRTPKVHRR
ncbi:MAG TPA: hypothetical protein VGS60_10365 [Actinomycetes bacterium]|nr:hypothetical protein [Actinomycetes bacterium]